MAFYGIHNLDLTDSFCCDFEFCLTPPVSSELLKNNSKQIKNTFLVVTHNIAPMNHHIC